MKKRIQLKEGVNIEDLQYVDPRVWILIAEAALYYEEHNLPFFVTSLMDDHQNRTTDTHRTARAADIRTRDPGGAWSMSKVHQQQMAFHLNQKYGHRWGTGKAGKVAQVVVIESDHIHLQVRTFPVGTP